MFQAYHKIETPFERDVNGTKKLIYGKYRNKYVEFLSPIKWVWKEKIDGTNIRIYWDGHKIVYGGRTDKAQLPAGLVDVLNKLFINNETEEIFEQMFGDKEVHLFGEGYGAGIQAVGKKYIKNGVDFILFDVNINGQWLAYDDVVKIGTALGLKVVPVLLEGSIDDAINYVKTLPVSQVGNCIIEGVVGCPKIPLKDGKGNRIITKIKCCDFNDERI